MKKVNELALLSVFSIIFVLLGVAGVQAYYSWSSPAVVVSGEYGKYWQNDVAVIIFTRESCVYCHQLEQFLNEKKVSYYKYDVDNNEQGIEYFAELNQQGTPLILLRDTMILGFQPDVIAEKLNLAKGI